MPTAQQQFKAKGLREQRGRIRAEMQKIGDKVIAEERAMSSEEKTAFDKFKTDFATVSEAIRAAEADMKALDDAVNAGAGDDEGGSDSPPADPAADGGSNSAGRGGIDFRSKRKGGDGATLERNRRDHALAMQAWARSAHGLGLTAEHQAACKRTGLNPRAKQFRVKLSDDPKRLRRDYSQLHRDYNVTGANGGYTIRPEFAGELELYLKDFSNVRGVVKEMRTETGATMPYPTADDTSNVGELLTEATEVAYQDTTFGVVNFGAYKFSSKGMLISFELLNDSAFNLEQILGAMAGERLGRIQGSYFTTGTGTSQPQGIVTGATLGITAASATAFTSDELIRTYFSINPAYRNAPGFGFMGNDTILATISLMKDGQGRPLFQASYRDGAPDMVFGKPWNPNQFMDSALTTGKKPVLAGDFSKFVIRDIGEIRLKRLDERWAEKDQVGFLAFMRSDSKVINTAALKYLQLA